MLPSHLEPTHAIVPNPYPHKLHSCPWYIKQRDKVSMHKGRYQASSFLLNPSFVLRTNQKVLSPLRETSATILNPPPRPFLRLWAFYCLIAPFFHARFQTLKHHSHPIDVVSCFCLNYPKHHGFITIGVTILKLDILEDRLI